MPNIIFHHLVFFLDFSAFFFGCYVMLFAIFSIVFFALTAAARYYLLGTASLSVSIIVFVFLIFGFAITFLTALRALTTLALGFYTLFAIFFTIFFLCKIVI